MNSLITKLARNEPFDNSDVERALYEICDDEHSSCNDACPVYEMNSSHCLNNHKPYKENSGCDCFKSGAKMASFLRGDLKDERNL